MLSVVLTLRTAALTFGDTIVQLGRRSMQRPHQEAVSWLLSFETASETACGLSLTLIGGEPIIQVEPVSASVSLLAKLCSTQHFGDNIPCQRDSYKTAQGPRLNNGDQTRRHVLCRIARRLALVGQTRTRIRGRNNCCFLCNLSTESSVTGCFLQATQCCVRPPQSR